MGKSDYTTSRFAAEAIGAFEGLRLKAYLCPASVPTIGYGHTKGVKMTDVITKDQAVDFLLQDLKQSELYVKNLVQKELNQNQFDALVSFVFNLGPGNFAKSMLLRKINVNPFDISIKAEFVKWNRAPVNGVLTVLPGLTRRRNWEAQTYFM